MGICHRHFTRLNRGEVESFDLEKIPMLRKGDFRVCFGGVGGIHNCVRISFSKKGLPGTEKGTFGYEDGDFRV